MRQADLERLRRSARWETLGGLLILSAIALVVAWLALRSSRAVDATTAIECRALYMRARTAADSARVDAQRPRVTKTGQMELRCGELRRQGTLSRR